MLPFLLAYCTPFNWTILVCRHSTLEQGFIILRLHYISPAIPAPFHAIYQSLVLPSFRSVMKQHCHFGHLPPAKRTRALPLADSDHPEWISPHEHDSHASITHAVIVSALLPAAQIFSAFFFSQRPEQSSSASTSHEPWWPLRFANTLFGDQLRNLWARRDPHQWGHKTKRWLGSPNQRTLSIQQAFPRPGPCPGFTKSDGDAPRPWPWPPKDVKLQVTISSWQATDLLLLFFFPLMIHLHLSNVHGHYLKASIPTTCSLTL